MPRSCKRDTEHICHVSRAFHLSILLLLVIFACAAVLWYFNTMPTDLMCCYDVKAESGCGVQRRELFYDHRPV